jgi:hypothetical protein
MSENNEADRRRAAQQEIAAQAIADGATYARAAELAGVVRRTITRWAKDPAFAARVSELRSEVVSRVTGELLSHGPDAVFAIRRELSEAERSADRLRAATLLLSLAHRYREQTELHERMREIEARLGITDPGGASTHEPDSTTDVPDDPSGSQPKEDES